MNEQPLSRSTGWLRASGAALRRDVRGLAAIEFAALIPIFLLLLVGIFDFTSIFYRKLQLSAAVAAGAQYAIENGPYVQGTTGNMPVSTYLANIKSVIQHATIVSPAVSGTTGILYNGATDSGSYGSCYCPNGSGLSSGTCGSTCADGTLAGSYVKITASLTYSPPISAAWVSGGTFTESAWVRVQ